MQTDTQPEPAPEIIERAKAMLAGSYARKGGDKSDSPLVFGLAWDATGPGERAFFTGLAQRMADSPKPAPYVPPEPKRKKAA